MDLSLWRNSVPRKLWRRTGIPWLRYSPFTKAQVVNPYGLIWMDMAQPIFFRCTFGPISLKTLVLLKFDFWSDIVMSTWLICRQKLRQELPSRIEEAKRSGVRILLNVKGWTWKTLNKQQLPFSVLDGCVFVILPSTTPLVCSIRSEQHPLISFRMR